MKKSVAVKISGVFVVAAGLAGCGTTMGGDCMKSVNLGLVSYSGYDDKCGQMQVAQKAIASDNPQLKTFGMTLASKVDPAVNKAADDVVAGRGVKTPVTPKPANGKEVCKASVVDPKTQTVTFDCK